MSEQAKPSGVVNIHGRDYETVALRVKRFRDAHPDWAILTEILHRDADMVLLRATIADPTGRVLATGHAEEWRKASAINKTSAIENAETSCIGRALAALGMGGTEFATANEIEIAKRKERVPGGVTGAELNKEAFDAMPEEEQKFLVDYATAVLALYESGGDVLGYLDANTLDNEEKMALWSLLPSNVRAAIKKARAETKPPAKEAA